MQMADTRDCVVNRCMKKVLSLASDSCGASIVVTTWTCSWMPDQRERGLFVVGAQIFVLLSTTKFLKCVPCSADHWSHDGIESHCSVFEWFGGQTQRHPSVKCHRSS